MSIDIKQKIKSNGISEMEITYDLARLAEMSGKYSNSSQKGAGDFEKNFTQLCAKFYEETDWKDAKCRTTEDYKAIMGGSFSLKGSPLLETSSSLLHTVYRYDLKNVNATLPNTGMAGEEGISDAQLLQAKSMAGLLGMELKYSLEMPGKITKADVGKITGNKVAVDIFDLAGKEHAYVESRGLNLPVLGMIIGVVAIAAAVASLAFIKKLKKGAEQKDGAAKKGGNLPIKGLISPENPKSRIAKLVSFFKIKKAEKGSAKEDKPGNPAGHFSFLKAKNADEADAEEISPEAAEEKKPMKGIFAFFRKKGKKEGIIEKFKQEEKNKAKKRAVIQERKHKIREHLERAGLAMEPGNLSKKIFTLCILINLAISSFLIYHFSVTYGITWSTILASIAVLWVLIFAVILFVLWVTFYVAVDVRIFKRKVNIEEVLPDYLQLTAANIKAGMTIDRALWYAVRPRFGVLANEIETVAKETMRGEDLKKALKKFADKYESLLLKRSVSLLIEGIEAGGEIGTLLNKIAINIDENRIMRQEMEANVTTYAIFISFATIVAAPALFALSGVLIKVIANLSTSLSGVSSASSAGFALTFSGAGIDYKDFKIFAIVSLIITSFFSSIIIATIKKGNAKLGFKYIPLFIVITITLFLITDSLMGKMLGVFL